jgi:hypothetical protein
MAHSCRSFPIVLPTRALALLLSLPLALACQKPEGTPPPSGNQPPERAIYSAPDASEVGEAYCYVAFSPDEAARPSFELAAARWSVAMGCEVLEGEGGVPIVATPLLYVVYDADDRPTLFTESAPGRRPLCGISIWDATLSHVERIHIALEDSACTGEDAATHELGHALSKLRRHAHDGVMAPGRTPEWSPLITEQSLALACAGTPCTSFEPER